MHHRKRKGGVRARRQLNVLMTMVQRFVSVGIYADQASSRFDCALYLRPQVDIRCQRIGAPENYQAGEMKVLYVSPDLNPAYGVAKPLAAGGGANGTGEATSAEPVKKSPVHTCAVYDSH